MVTERVGKASREIENKNSQLWIIYWKKRILIEIGFGAIISVQMILMNLENAWRIGTITNGERSKGKSIAEGKRRNEKDELVQGEILVIKSFWDLLLFAI